MAALVISFLGISGPSFWLDEAATLSMARRDLPDFTRAVTEHLDLVHAGYYLVMRQWLEIFGYTELGARSLSALAACVAAAGITALGRRCASTWVGLVAGLVYAGNVTVTRYAQEARPYALATAMGVVATYVLVRAVQSPRWWWTWLAAHAVAMVLVGVLNLFALLLAAAHLLMLAGGFLSRVTRMRVFVGWCVSSLITGLVLYPFVTKAQSQKHQVASIPYPTSEDVWRLVEFLSGHESLIWVSLAASGLGLLAGLRRAGWVRRERDVPAAEGLPAPTLSALAAPWLLLPPVILLTVSVATPLYRHRYMVVCLPALALLMAAGLVWTARLWRPLPLAGLAAFAVLVVPPQFKIREADERWDDLRTPAAVLKRHAHSGDAVLFLTPAMRWRSAGYPDAYRGLDDVMLAQTPAQAGNLVGADTQLEVMKRRLCLKQRVWVFWDLAGKTPPPAWVQARLRFVGYAGAFLPSGEWRFKRGKLTLMTRSMDAGPTKGCRS
ncbi:hypothetical protein GCM10010411_70210 [Actinomadura fulvescens]|uniref:Glycosyltransferase RgtA/B/C/D-like domain-containing protein n=1 Tax=Actinomadura fulvescens TaxID=46160 RepID=A0ABN3QDV2_9ACTN